MKHNVSVRSLMQKQGLRFENRGGFSFMKEARVLSSRDLREG